MKNSLLHSSPYLKKILLELKKKLQLRCEGALRNWPGIKR